MDENRASLEVILEHSPFNTEEELLTELQGIESTTGTKIIIWNLRRSGFIPMVTRLIEERLALTQSLCLYIHYRTSENEKEKRKMELDVITEDDIRILRDDSVPESDYSLRVSSSELS